MLFLFVGLFFAVFAISFWLTGQVRNYALRKKVLDIPNERSSHTIPTPRGGGVAVVIVFLIALCSLWAGGFVSGKSLLAFGCAGFLVSVVGFLDDHGHIAARWRLLTHAISAIFIVIVLGGFPKVTILNNELNIAELGYVLAVLYLIWLLNLYNFMDGIDGLASIEAITVCIGAALCSLIINQWEIRESSILPFILAGSVAGFLVWNYPPAKIFMGDACSGFLGLIIGGMSIQAAWENSDMFWCWLILLALFITDATITLFRRLLRGDKVYEAHRSHAYQFASRYFGAHKPVTIACMLINIFWLLPISLCVAVDMLDGFLAVLVAYFPVFLLAWKFKAGAAELLSR